MSLHIEINGECSPQEWEALAAFVAVMRGTTALTPISAPASEPDPIPAGASVAIVPPPPPSSPPPPPSSPASVADALIEAEEKRVAAASTGAAAPTPPPPPSAPAAGGVETDNRGLPWDARIHASTKVKNNDGTWRNKRGVEKALVEQVEAELRQVMAAPAAAAPMPSGDAPDTDDDDTAAPVAPPPPAGDVPVPPAPPPPPPVEDAAAPAPAPDTTAFTNMMRMVVSKQTAGSLSPEQVTAIAQSLGLTSVRDFGKRPDLIPAFEALLP